ncbi:MAG TPA: hypothetical protein PKC30_04460 [Saprospiraceae bacterium]|nr:hypothetical protein [Saprospiraceae bacterium]
MNKAINWWVPEKGEWIFIFGVILLFLNRYIFGNHIILEGLFSLMLIIGGIVAYKNKNKNEKQHLKIYWITVLILITIVLIYITLKFDLLNKASF